MSPCEEFVCKSCWVDLEEDVELCPLCEERARLDREFDEKAALGYL